MNKLVELDTAMAFFDSVRAIGEQTVLTNGCFDVNELVKKSAVEKHPKIVTAEIPGAGGLCPATSSTTAATAQRLGLGRLSGKCYNGKPTGQRKYDRFPSPSVAAPQHFPGVLSRLAGTGTPALVFRKSLPGSASAHAAWRKNWNKTTMLWDCCILRVIEPSMYVRRRIMCTT